MIVRVIFATHFDNAGMNNFWTGLPRPVFTLAPMEDVTDTSFRELVMSISDPRFFHVIFTEFTSTDGLCHEVGRKKVIDRLRVNTSERAILKQKGFKIVAQIWGANPEKYFHATRLICNEFEFDGIDINMGCPVKKIIKQGACSALIGQPVLAREIVLATKEASNLPVSIKTRTGIRKHDTGNWIGHLLETDPAAIILHARTQVEQSESVADWREVMKAVSVREQSGKNIPILGNGDVSSVEDAFEKCRITGADGVMIGRGIFHNPWFFNHPTPAITVDHRLELLLRHVELFTKTWGAGKNFSILKRFFKIYASNFDGAGKLRAELMETSSGSDVRHVIEEFLNN